MSKRPTNRDVASAADVSTGTVSNVLNRPHSVAGATRARVERAMLELGFRRESQAPSLRSNGSTRGGSHGPGSRGSELSWQDIPLCRRVTVLQSGVMVGSGLNECSMPDGSGIWVRFDDGRGRLLLTQDQGYEIRPAPMDR